MADSVRATIRICEREHSAARPASGEGGEGEEERRLETGEPAALLRSAAADRGGRRGRGGRHGRGGGVVGFGSSQEFLEAGEGVAVLVRGRIRGKGITGRFSLLAGLIYFIHRPFGLLK